MGSNQPSCSTHGTVKLPVYAGRVTPQKQLQTHIISSCKSLCTASHPEICLCATVNKLRNYRQHFPCLFSPYLQSAQPALGLSATGTQRQQPRHDIQLEQSICCSNIIPMGLSGRELPSVHCEIPISQGASLSVIAQAIIASLAPFCLLYVNINGRCIRNK